MFHIVSVGCFVACAVVDVVAVVAAVVFAVVFIYSVCVVSLLSSYVYSLSILEVCLDRCAVVLVVFLIQIFVLV